MAGSGIEGPGAGEMISGGVAFPAAWLRCRVSASAHPDEALVRIRFSGEPGILAFLVDRGLVEAPGRLGEEEIEGRVKVLLLERHDDSAVVEILGEPLSFGPKIVVPRDALSSIA